MKIYNKFKYGFYVLGIILTVIFMMIDGLTINSHTPSLGFVLPFLFLILGFVWGIMDMILKYFSSKTILFKSHVIGISVNTLMIVGDYLYLLSN